MLIKFNFGIINANGLSSKDFEKKNHPFKTGNNFMTLTSFNLPVLILRNKNNTSNLP
jgi:hypothetical protein